MELYWRFSALAVSLALYTVFLAHAQDGHALEYGAERYLDLGQLQNEGQGQVQEKNYLWFQKTTRDAVIEKRAYLPRDRKTITISSLDHEGEGFHWGRALYDFESNDPKMVLRFPKSPCFLRRTSHTYEQLVSYIENQEEHSVIPHVSSSLDATGELMTLAEVEQLYKQHPSFRHMCGVGADARIVHLELPDQEFDGMTTEMKMMSFDEELVIKMRKERPGERVAR